MERDGPTDSGDSEMTALAPDFGAKSRPAPMKGRAGRIMLWFLAGFSAAILLFAAGFFAFAIRVASMRPADDPPVSDAIIVLTGGYNRLETGLELLRQGKAKRLLISGVYPRTRLSDIRRATGADPQLFSCCIDIDHAALDTIGNAAESAKWLESRGYHKVLLVTNNYHMPRSLLETRRVFGNIEVVPEPVVTREIGIYGWLTRRDALRVLCVEYVKYLAALVRSAIPASWEQDSQTALGIGAIRTAD